MYQNPTLLIKESVKHLVGFGVYLIACDSDLLLMHDEDGAAVYYIYLLCTSTYFIYYISTEYFIDIGCSKCFSFVILA